MFPFCCILKVRSMKHVSECNQPCHDSLFYFYDIIIFPPCLYEIIKPQYVGWATQIKKCLSKGYLLKIRVQFEDARS